MTTAALPVTPGGARIRWLDVPGTGPARLFVHGLGASGAHHFLPSLTHPALAGRHGVVVDLLGSGTSDRPADFDHTTTSHAATLVALLRHLDASTPLPGHGSSRGIAA